MIDGLHVFVGPTLRPEDRALLPDARFHPPVVQGDVYQLVSERPLAIGIIDGYFERVPAVWHKEILWALSEGVHVFGSASMGALRAAELSSFGMIGIGAIFNDFAAGRLEDDDEVTLVHAESKYNFRHGSEPLVNMRATLASAVRKGIIIAATEKQLVQYLKNLYYPHRDYDAMLTWAAESDLPADETDRLKTWISNRDNRVDQKRDDALEMLAAMRSLSLDPPGPKQVKWTFQNTDAWEQVKRTMPEGPEEERGEMPSTFDAIIDELRLHPDEYIEVKRQALLRQLRLRLSLENGGAPSTTQIEASSTKFRQERGLFKAASVKTWLKDQLMTDWDYDRLMKDQARIERVTMILSGNLEATIRDVLRCRSRFGAFSRRAALKQAVEMSGRYGTLPIDAVSDVEEVVRWFFENHLGEPLPDDLHDYIDRLDLKSMEHFVGLIRREYLFQKMSSVGASDVG